MRWHVSFHACLLFLCQVSIPKRVSDALAPDTPLILGLYGVFQSLRGFPMRWHEDTALNDGDATCFNP